MQSLATLDEAYLWVKPKWIQNIWIKFPLKYLNERWKALRTMHWGSAVPQANFKAWALSSNQKSSTLAHVAPSLKVSILALHWLLLSQGKCAWIFQQWPHQDPEDHASGWMGNALLNDAIYCLFQVSALSKTLSTINAECISRKREFGGHPQSILRQSKDHTGSPSHKPQLQWM